MSMQWPEDGAVQPRRRRRQSGPRPGNPLPTTELFDDSDDGEIRRSRLAYLLPTLVVLAVLIIVGLLLAFGGPLPSIFPRLDCGACQIRS